MSSEGENVAVESTEPVASPAGEQATAAPDPLAELRAVEVDLMRRLRIWRTAKAEAVAALTEIEAKLIECREQIGAAAAVALLTPQQREALAKQLGLAMAAQSSAASPTPAGEGA